MLIAMRRNCYYFPLLLITAVLMSACVSKPGAVTLGGKISGLKGTIILSNSGLQSYTGYYDGEFTFLGSLLQGDSYNVTVAQQPTGQTCVVSGGQGVFGADNVKSVVVSCLQPLVIGSWNVQNYGPSKAAVPTIMDELSKVIMHFDVIFIQEMPTATTSVTCAGHASMAPSDCLLARLNDADRAGPLGYSLLPSSTSGSGGNAEKYACYYKTSKITVLTSYLADAAVPAITPAITFTRPPFIVRLKAGSLDFFVVSIHTTPDNVLTRSEINQLPYVANYLAPTDADIIILGDFNSGSTYFTPSTDWTPYFNNFTTSGYANYITETMDTTVSTGNTYTYDRMTLSPSLAGKVENASAGPYYFDGLGAGATCTSGDTPALMNAIIAAGCSGGILFGHVSNPCTCNGAASEVSDHYPVGLQLNY